MKRRPPVSAWLDLALSVVAFMLAGYFFFTRQYAESCVFLLLIVIGLQMEDRRKP